MYRYLFLIILCLGGTAYAQTPDTLLIERMTSYEVRDAITAGKTTVIVPSGGSEQNGPGMVIGKHNFRVVANGQTIARRLGNALVAPVIIFTPNGDIDPPTGHMRHPGTFSVPENVYAQVLEYVVRSLKQHGFRDIALIGDHGSDQKGQDAVAAKLNKEWASTNVRVHAIGSYYRGDPEGDAAEMMKRGIKKEEIGNHADVRDTSQMLAIDPTMVRTGKLEAGNGKNGVEGDPRRASAQIGRVLVERTVTRATEQIRKSIAAR
ncbi:MAG: creatininase family protein [Rhizobiales bacterium]|nr:creatininase family protein [Hyphomicrobiales bacterium]